MATNNALWYLECGGAFEVKEAPYNAPGPGEVVIKNRAVAINPMDWKIQAAGPAFPLDIPYPFILGSDFAGEVFEVGEGVTKFKKGDRVLGGAKWFLTHESRDGAFQNYTIGKTGIIAHLPDSVSFAAGSVLPLALSTSAMGLYPKGRLELPLPSTTIPERIGKVVLIWGGSSSCGSAAIQLAVASGATVISTASERNHEFVKGLGASAVLDYKSESIVGDLVKVIHDTPGEFIGALDAVAEEPAIRACADVLKELGGGRLVSNRPFHIDGLPDGVEFVGVTDTSQLLNTKDIGPYIWGEFIPDALKSGVLKPVPEPLVVGEGLEKIIDGCALLQKGVSAAKVVVEL